MKMSEKPVKVPMAAPLPGTPPENAVGPPCEPGTAAAALASNPGANPGKGTALPAPGPDALDDAKPGKSAEKSKAGKPD
jgi:hypothetical protein